MPFPNPCATGRDDLLDTAKALLVEALEMAERLLSGFPIPGAKGTIGAVLHIIAEAEVCTEVKLYYLLSYRRRVRELPRTLNFVTN